MTQPEYLEFSRLQERFPDVPRIALTATADELTRQDIIKYLGLEKGRVFISSFDRPNIHYKVILNPPSGLLVASSVPCAGGQNQNRIGQG